MDVKNIFHRLKNSWKGSEVRGLPVISQQQKDAKEYIEYFRAEQIRNYGCKWIPFDKWCYAKGLKHSSRDHQLVIHAAMGYPEKGQGPSVEFLVEMRWVAVLFPATEPTPADIEKAYNFYRYLTNTLNTPIWDGVYAKLGKTRAEVNIPDYYILSTSNIEPGFDEPIALTLWHIGGKPSSFGRYTINALDAPSTIERKRNNHYSLALSQVIRAVEHWTGPIDPIPKRIIEMTSIPEEPNVVTLIRKTEMYGNTMHHTWHVRTGKGTFPVKMNDKPNVDIMTQPFYRFEFNPVHDASTCVIRVATGTLGHYWYILVSKAMEIISIIDDEGVEMECVTIPADSQAMDLFRIECSLKDCI